MVIWKKDLWENNIKMVFKKTLVGLVILGTLASPVRCEGKSLWYRFVTSPIKTKKAEKALTDYLSDGYLTSSEKSQVLKIINNKEVRKKIYTIETRLEAEAKARRREAEARRKAFAKQSYKLAVDAHKHDDPYSAKYNIDEAIKNNPNHVGYKIYGGYLKGSKKVKEDLKEVKGEIKEAKEEIKKDLKRTGSWLGNKFSTLKRKLRR